MTEIICVSCPVGCELQARYENETLQVTGNQCPAGIEYAQEELTAPTRNIATSIKVTGGDMAMLSVKTSKPIPKSEIMNVTKEIHKITATAPIKIGDIMLANASNTGVDIIATRHVGVVEISAK